jgi:hypothetical protein
VYCTARLMLLRSIFVPHVGFVLRLSCDFSLQIGYLLLSSLSSTLRPHRGASLRYWEEWGSRVAECGRDDCGKGDVESV